MIADAPAAMPMHSHMNNKDMTMEPDMKKDMTKHMDTACTMKKDMETDCFGLLSAAKRTTQPITTTHYLLGHVAQFIVRAFALTPAVLLVALPIAAARTFPHPRYMAAAGGIWAWFLLFLVKNFRLLDGNAGRAPATTMPTKKKVVVIGAGPVGITAVKECMEKGHEVKAYEQRSELGGVFNYSKERLGGAWKSCSLVSSPWVTAYSDFPPRGYQDNHMSHKQYQQYIADYATHFNLWPRLNFGHSVLAVRRAVDGVRWEVDVMDDATQTKHVDIVDNVVVCAGLHLRQKNLHIPGIKTFKGKVMYVNQYKTPEDFKGKKVIIVGNGESSVDVANDICKLNNNVFMSIRRGKFVISRINAETSIANDYDTNRARYSTPVVARDWYSLFVRRVSYYLGLHDSRSAATAQFLESSKIGPFSQAATKNDEFIKPVLRGDLKIRPEIKSFENNTVHFQNGISEDDVDVVIFACGYSPSFPFIEWPHNVSEIHPGEMYLRTFVPEIGESLSFSGYARPTIGAIPPTGELQNRYIALLASGERKLPCVKTMRKEVAAQIDEQSQMFPTVPKPGVVVSWIRYMDIMAGKIGCRPAFTELIKDPALFAKVLTGPMTGAMYRLCGQDKWEGARDTLMSLTGTQPMIEVLTHVGMNFWLFPASQIFNHAAWKQHSTFI